MPLIIKNKSDRFAFQIGVASALRKTNDLVNQLQEQLKAERAQHRFNPAEKERELTILLKELSELRYELAHRDTFDAFARAPSPSRMMH